MTTSIADEGIACDYCEQTGEKPHLEIDGVTDATADREAESATVEGTAEVDGRVSAVTEAGYDASA